MRRATALGIVFCVLVGCAGPTRIHAPGNGDEWSAARRCGHIFPQGRWQFTHILQAVPAGMSPQTLIGVVRMDATEQTFECVMLTLEGMVLLEAHYRNGRISVPRAIPPMNAPGVAQGMVEDILLLFFRPPHPPAVWGTSQGHAWICRYPHADGAVLDIVIHPDNQWEIRHYGPGKHLRRTITSGGRMTDSSHGFPEHLEIRAHGPSGYRLNMRLVEALALETHMQP